MNVIVVGLAKMIRLQLPDSVSGNYQLLGYNGKIIATIIGVKAWQIQPADGLKLSYNGVQGEAFQFNDNAIFVIDDINNKISYTIYIYNPDTTPYKTFETGKQSLSIGGGNGSDINFPTNSSFNLTMKNGYWFVETSSKRLYVNDELVTKKNLLHGDLIFMDGIKIIPYDNKIVVQSVNNSIAYNVSNSLTEVNLNLANNIKDNAYLLSTEKSVFDGQEMFNKAPRFESEYIPKKIKVTPPPEREQSSMKPSILQAGPQITMVLMTVVSAFSSIISSANSNNKLTLLTTIIVLILTIISTAFWPAISNAYDKREKKKNEILRIKNYRKYLEKKEQELRIEHGREKQILLDNNVSLDECQEIIYKRKRNLWERDVTQKDFLNISLGVGTIKPTIDVTFQEEDFSSDDDFLVDELRDMIKRNDHIDDVPECISLVKKDALAILGAPNISQKFINSIILQLVTFQSFIDLKIVVFTNKNNKRKWEYCDILPHCWNNQKSFRYIAYSPEEMNIVSNELMKDYKERLSSYEEKNKDKKKSDMADEKNSKDQKEYMNHTPYYVIIIDDLENSKNIEIIKKILESPINLGYSLIIKNDRISNLPSKCSTFIYVNEEVSGLFENVISESNQIQFKPNISNNIDMYGCSMMLANVPLIPAKAKYELPKSISFLDMYEVGNVEQLNILDRWKNNNIISSLSVPIGIDQNGNKFMMDIHEKAYGPHGLVAGTTGSGKSEWIITYILSLAVNFSPLEVQFVIIDYKGGGLAGTFENKQLGIKLPHLIGTITNLDKSEVRRSLVSIESELKRRQKMFNDAREKLKVSSMDIYKYQDYYRQGLLDEPMSHLLIISDEFAELKSQQPEFLDQLVSTARIGRSLGVHLILATQKPSGVVDDQIWSNSKFKVCLKVADQSDSKEMINRPDAAFLKTTGSFYLLVGNDEYYMLGQSAYAGFKYVPSNTLKKKIDEDIHVIDEEGNEKLTITNIKESMENKADLGEELTNVLKYICNAGKTITVPIKKLWLDKMPNLIYTDELRKKFNYKKESYIINPILGEYDDPYTQSQNLCTLNISKYGNIIIYGGIGSGKELLLQSLVYSIASTYIMSECNIYIMDFGAQTLKVYDDCPIVGNVILGDESDKIVGLFVFLISEIKRRKELYSEFGGSYEQYIANSGKKDPYIIVMLNNYDGFVEKYADSETMLQLILSSCVIYGISFIVTNTSVLRIKTEQLFGKKLCLNYKTNDEYQNVFINDKDIFPAEGKARGIFERDKYFYEFQTSLPIEESKINEFIKRYDASLLKAYNNIRVPSVRYLPKFVTIDEFDTTNVSMNSLPIGIKTKTIKDMYYDFEKNLVVAISSSNIEYLEDFTSNFVSIVKKDTKDSIFLIDANKTIDFGNLGKVKYVNKDEQYNQVISNLNVYVKDLYKKINNNEKVDTSLNTYVLFFGISKLLSKIDGSLADALLEMPSMFDKVKNVHFILIDTFNNFKDISRSQLGEMFKGNCILIGNGIDSQFVFEYRKLDTKIPRDGIPDDYGYAITNGKGVQIKVIESIKAEDDE